MRSIMRTTRWSPSPCWGSAIPQNQGLGLVLRERIELSRHPPKPPILLGFSLSDAEGLCTTFESHTSQSSRNGKAGTEDWCAIPYWVAKLLNESVSQAACAAASGGMPLLAAIHQAATSAAMKEGA